ncbi:putative Secreted Protein [Cryptosporidium tyzzeri]|nr:putative Secreted Protein [Cryptosporidium tyzzeri]
MIFLRVLITCLTLLIVTHITLFISLNNEIGNHLNDKITKINSQAVFISFLEIPGLKRKKKYSKLS